MLSLFLTSNKKTNTVCMLARLEHTNVRQRATKFWIYSNYVFMLKEVRVQRSSTIPDPGYQWESDKLTDRNHKREPRGQPFPIR